MNHDDEARLRRLISEATDRLAEERARGEVEAEAELIPVRATQAEIDQLYRDRIEGMLALVPGDPDAGELPAVAYTRALHLARDLEPFVTGALRAEIDERLRRELHRFGLGDGPAPCN